MEASATTADQLRWDLADAPKAQGALFDDPIFEREPGRGEFRGMEFLHVRARTIINRVPGPPRFGFGHTINVYRGCSHACSYCLSGETPVLTGDGRTKRLADVRAGDIVYGTVRIGAYRRYVRTSVLDHWETVKPAYRITLEDGTELIASSDHRFLTDRRWKHVTGAEHGRARRPHLTTNNSLLGLGSFALPPKKDDDYRQGYLCGIVRGDGHLGSYTYDRPGRGESRVHRFRLALVDLEALGRARRYLAHLGVETSEYSFAEATARRRPLRAIRTQAFAGVTAIAKLIGWPETPSLEWRKGFLAGIFDAEGSHSCGVFRIANTDPEIIEWVNSSLCTFGFLYTVETQANRNGLTYVRLDGGLRERIRFFHLTDPAITRKLSIEGMAIKSDARLGVVSIEPLGIHLPMYDITTGTGDFIADGVVSHNCFARPTHAYLDLGIGEDFERKIVVKVNAVERLRVELDPRRWAGDLIAMGTNTDPYQRCEGKYHLTQGVIEVLTAHANPFSILTKSTLVLRDLEMLAEAVTRTQVNVALSIGTLDEEVWRATEPGTPHPRQRMRAVEKLNAAGVPCGVLVAPILPGLSDRPEQIEAVVGAARRAGAASIGSSVLHLRPGVKEVFLDHLSTTHPRLLPSYRRLYPEGRSNAPKVDQHRITEIVRRSSGRPRRRPRAVDEVPPASAPAPKPAATQMPLL